MNTEITNPKIEILPEHIIDQIKAGEVLERPASLIKELVENSLDARSSEISIHLIENGMDLLSIEDNGQGMNFNNLPFAFLRHATSKLKTFDDLYRLRSFGFRGEALASIAASARVTCVSQPKDLQEDGGKIILNGGVQELLIPYKQTSAGTSIFIKDLFYNTPARLKFIKSKVSEKSALKKMIYSFVLSNPQVFFQIKWDEKEKEIYKNDSNEAQRIEQVFFGKSSTEEKKVWSGEEFYDDYHVSVFFTPSTHTTPQYRHHYLFANGRYFIDKSLHQAVLRNLEPIWKFGESGHYVVKINAPSAEIDVNVHPNKTQIKFLKSDTIYSLLVSSIRSALKAHSVQKNFSEAIFSAPSTQPSLISRDENQRIDLQSMFSNGTEFQKPQLNSSPGMISLSEHLSVIELLTKNFLLIKKHQSFFIVDISALLSLHFCLEIKNFMDHDEQAGPLLISEPFRITFGKIDDSFIHLKAMGLEFDRLNPEIIALRTLPKYIPQTISRLVVELILQFFQSHSNAFQNEGLARYLKMNWNLKEQLPVSILVNILERTTVDQSSYMTELTDQTLREFLK